MSTVQAPSERGLSVTCQKRASDLLRARFQPVASLLPTCYLHKGNVRGVKTLHRVLYDVALAVVYFALRNGEQFGITGTIHRIGFHGFEFG